MAYVDQDDIGAYALSDAAKTEILGGVLRKFLDSDNEVYVRLDGPRTDRFRYLVLDGSRTLTRLEGEIVRGILLAGTSLDPELLR